MPQVVLAGRHLGSEFGVSQARNKVPLLAGCRGIPGKARWIASTLVGLVAAAGCAAVEGTGTTDPSGARIVALVDTTTSADGTQAAQRRHLVDVVIPLAEEQRAEVVLATIDAAALEAPEIVAATSFDTASAEGNDVVADRLVVEATHELTQAADTVFAAGGRAEASDVAGALSWAASMLDDGIDGWRGVALLSDAVSTAAPCNMTLLPPSDARPVLAACFPAGVPDLAGVEVLFLGAGSYRTGDQRPVDPAGLERFWRTVVQQGGGTVRAYGATVLEAGPASERGDDHA